MSNELKTQWHPAFCAAMRLELAEDREYLDYVQEYNLSSKPLGIDLLIVKKIKEIEIKNEIGKLFREHNIIEYKSPDDSMNVNTFLKVIAYACLYKTQEEHMDDIVLDEITITLVRKRKPIKLFQWLRENGYKVLEKYRGIYYIIKEGCFPTQVVVSQVDSLTEESEKKYADSVLQVTLQENTELFHKLKEEGKMCEALRKLMEPEFTEALQQAKEQAIQQGMQQGIQQGIQQTLRNVIVKLFNAGNSAEDISRIIEVPLDEVMKALA